MNKARQEAEKAFKKSEVKMESEISLEDMAKEITELDTQLRDMKKAYREKKYEGLKIAMDARKSADEAVNEELKSLGLRAFPFNRSTSIWW